jgi:hypothetical protein
LWFHRPPPRWRSCQHSPRHADRSLGRIVWVSSRCGTAPLPSPLPETLGPRFAYRVSAEIRRPKERSSRRERNREKLPARVPSMCCRSARGVSVTWHPRFSEQSRISDWSTTTSVRMAEHSLAPRRGCTESKRARTCCAERVASIMSSVMPATGRGIYGMAWFGDLDEHPGRRLLS